MILSRRQVHLYANVALAVLLPICFLAGLLLRPNYDVVDNSADELFQRSAQSQVEQLLTFSQGQPDLMAAPPLTVDSEPG